MQSTAIKRGRVEIADPRSGVTPIADLDDDSGRIEASVELDCGPTVADGVRDQFARHVQHVRHARAIDKPAGER